jgi:hypothetical protein
MARVTKANEICETLRTTASWLTASQNASVDRVHHGIKTPGAIGAGRKSTDRLPGESRRAELRRMFRRSGYRFADQNMRK